MIRFGMNKKTVDPIDPQYPFYFKKDGVYQPVRTLYVSGPSKSFYACSNSSYKYVWMETDFPVHEITMHGMTNKIHINKENLISNIKQNTDFPVCSVHVESTVRWCDEFVVEGPIQLVYKQNNIPEVWIETNSPITLIGERFDYIP